MSGKAGAFMVACSLALAAPTSAGAEKRRRPSLTRTVEVHYEGGAVPFVACIDLTEGPGNCPTIFSRIKERYVTVKVMDDLSPVGYADISWQAGGHDFFPVCGETSEPMEIPAGAELTVYPWLVPGTDCPNGVSTSGVVELTFSRRP